MAELTVDLTYGQALLDAARETDLEQQILEEGEGLVGLLESEPELKAFIGYPAISAEEKKKVLKEIFEGQICEELLNFLYILVDKRRTGRFAGIMKVYKNMLEREEGVSYGTVYSVIKLDEDRLAKLEEQTSRLLQKKVRLENEIDPKLIAGIRIFVDGKVIDASYQKKFEEMASQMNIS